MPRSKKELATYMTSATGGASDANSGGGAGSGNPDAETAMRAGPAVTRGNVQRDKAKLFPERSATKSSRGGSRAGAKKTTPAKGRRRSK